MDVGHEGLGVDVQLPAEGRPEQLLLRLGLRGRRGAARAGAAAWLDVRLVPAVGSRVATAPAAAPVRLHFVAAPQGSAAPKRLPGEGEAGGGTDSALAPPIPRVLRRPDASAVGPLGLPYPLPAASPAAMIVVFISPDPHPAHVRAAAQELQYPSCHTRARAARLPRTDGKWSCLRSLRAQELQLPAALARAVRPCRSRPLLQRREGHGAGVSASGGTGTARGSCHRSEITPNPSCRAEVRRDRAVVAAELPGKLWSTRPPTGCKWERCPTCPAEQQDAWKVPILVILLDTLTWLLPCKKPHTLTLE